MGRSAKLVKVRVGRQQYWSTSSGGQRVYFGNVKDVTRDAAEEAFLAHRQSLISGKAVNVPHITVAELCDHYLQWSGERLSDPNCKMKKTCLTQWCRHRVGSGGGRYANLFGAGKLIGVLPARKITAEHLEDFVAVRKTQVRLVGISAAQLAAVKKKVTVEQEPNKVDLNTAKKARLLELAGIGNRSANRIIANRPFKSVNDLDAVFYDSTQPVGPTSLAAAETQIMAAWRWAAQEGNKLPPDCRPFIAIRKVKIPQPLKLEVDLPTHEEVARLIQAGDSGPIPGFGDLLRCYYAIGPRTRELADIVVRDVEFAKKQVTLGRHKRDKSLTDPRPRTLTLNAETYDILKRQCFGKEPNDYVFQQPNGQRWTTDRLDKCFKETRLLAGVRDSLTLYSFRHLWISDQLQTDTPLVLIAEMAGTSIRQIEKTYGHIRTEHKQRAQQALDELRARRQAG